MRYTPTSREETTALERKTDATDDLADEAVDRRGPHTGVMTRTWHDGYRTGIRNALAACIEKHHYEAARDLSALLVKIRGAKP